LTNDFWFPWSEPVGFGMSPDTEISKDRRWKSTDGFIFHSYFPYDSARQLIILLKSPSTSAASTHHFFITSYQPFVAAQAHREAHRLCVDLAALFGQALGHVSHL